uniref:Uncharacterized protein n=1 Tax=Dendroctonus ponderosae TaxID=77166 RepID=A0AAR5PKV5_DENPD
MCCLRTLGVLTVTLSLVWSMTLETTSTRPRSSDTDNAINHIPDINSSTLNILDVRTPPKVQSQIKDKLSSKYSIEASHAGVAIPIDEDVVMEESTKRANFYKLDRPTTASGGLSTWILLSGHSSSTTPSPATKKPSLKPEINETLSEKPTKLSKPVFKQRSTTLKPVTTTSKKTTTVRVNTFSPSAKTTTRKPAKLTKVKASLLQSLTNPKANNATTTAKPAKHASTTLKSVTMREVTTTLTTTQLSASLPLEAKEDDSTLPSTKASKKKTQKKKKNKTRKRKPSKSSKEGNNKLKEVESPGTQLYSYLRSEIIPVTVGVSLVGLLVTAGLASYYLQPFAALRRSDPIDRKDTAGSYYYQDDYTNAMPEEEAIGKVIAGMPENVLQENTATTYKQPTSRNAYQQNVRYRQVDRRSQIFMNPYGSVEDVKLHDRPAVSYNEDNKFVGGSAQTEEMPEVTPAVVPEHGPRNLKDADRKFVVGNIPEEFYSSGSAPRSMQMRGAGRRSQTTWTMKYFLEKTTSTAEIVGSRAQQTKFQLQLSQLQKNPRLQTLRQQKRPSRAPLLITCSVQPNAQIPSLN